jgi:hypothetical protein
MSEFASAILISLGILCVAFLGVACSILADIRYAIRNLQITVNNAAM